jgi:protein involved in polysaccharide export with SLBB domain
MPAVVWSRVLALDFDPFAWMKTGLVLALLGLGGCSTGAQWGFVPATDVSLAKLDRIYRLGVGDKLKVEVFGEPELTGESEVNASGNISLPLLGDVPAKGTTLDQFSGTLRQRLQQGYIKNPQLNVQVLNYRPIYVQGEVRHGGEFPFKAGLSIADAVALAGGYTYRSVTSSILLRRQGEATGRVIPMDGTIPVLPGDNLLVQERFF